MNIVELGAIGELVGGVAVIASLLYVGLQVRQSSAISKATTEIAVGLDINRLSESVYGNSEVAQILIKAEADEPLSEVQSRMFRAYMTRLITNWITVQQAYSHGVLSRDYFERFKDDVAETCAQYPALQRFMHPFLKRSPKWKNAEIFDRIREGL